MTTPRSGFLERIYPEATAVLTVESFFLLPFMLRNTNLVAITHERLARKLECMGDFKIVKLPSTRRESQRPCTGIHGFRPTLVMRGFATSSKSA
jgi:hypothetical protein